MVLEGVTSTLLKIPGFWLIFIISLFISLFITLVQKFLTDQNRLKEIKEEMKSFQKRIKEETDTEEKMKLQKESMKLPMEQMKHSMKTMMYTFIPIIIIFPWMGNNLAFNSILPGEEFTINLIFESGADGEVELDVPKGLSIVGNNIQTISNEEMKWNLKGDEGEYLIQFITDSGVESKEVLITEEQKYKRNIKTKPQFSFLPPKEGHINENGIIKSIQIEYGKKIYIPLFGGRGWLFTYIVFSIIFSIALRKIIKVY